LCRTPLPRQSRAAFASSAPRASRSEGAMTVDTSVCPPRYDPTYRPDPTADFWFPELECLHPGARDALILDKLRRQVAWAWERSPFYRRKWDAAGVSPATLHSLDDLAKFPVVQKAELRLSQAAAPPYGEYLCIEPGEVARIHGTSGTTGRPTVFGIGREDWERIGEAHARILWGAALRTRVCSGEPGAGIPATERLIEETFGGRCVDMGSMAEMTPWMTNAECRARTGMHLWQDLVYTQVCDPGTFAPQGPGAEGTPV